MQPCNKGGRKEATLTSKFGSKKKGKLRRSIPAVFLTLCGVDLYNPFVIYCNISLFISSQKFNSLLKKDIDYSKNTDHNSSQLSDTSDCDITFILKSHDKTRRHLVIEFCNRMIIHEYRIFVRMACNL